MSNGTASYPYWDSSNRYMVSGVTGAETVFGQVLAHPSGFWRLRCEGSRSACPEKLGPYFSSLADAQNALQTHCQVVHYIDPPPGGPPVAPPAPQINSIDPQFAVVSTAFTLTVYGQNFLTGTSEIYFDGASQTTTFVSDSQLTCPIAATQIPTARYYQVKVFDSTTGTSNPVSFSASAAALLAAPPTDPTTPSKIIPRF